MKYSILCAWRWIEYREIWVPIGIPLWHDPPSYRGVMGEEAVTQINKIRADTAIWVGLE